MQPQAVLQHGAQQTPAPRGGDARGALAEGPQGVQGPAEAQARATKRARWVSQITPPSPAAGSGGRTPVSQAGFRTVVPGKGQGLMLLSIEVHADSRCVRHAPHPTPLKLMQNLIRMSMC